MPYTGKATYNQAPTPELTDDASDLVGLISPFDTPLLDAIGSPRFAATSTRHEWFDGPSGGTRERRENFTSIFKEMVDLTAPMDAASHHAIEREFDYQVIQRLRELMRALENAAINGTTRSAPARSMKGILHFGVELADAKGDMLSEDGLNAALRAMQDAGGTPNAIVCGGFQKRRISDFIQSRRKYEPETTALRNLVDVYESDFGVQRVILSRWVPADKVLLLDLDKLQVMPLAGRSFFVKPLAGSGDFRKAQIIGEYTLECLGAPGVICGLATQG